MNVAVGASCLLFSACERKVDNSAWWDGERERVELQSRLDLLKYRHASGNSGVTGDLSGLTVEAGRLARTKEQLAGERLALLTDIATLEAAISGSDGERLKSARAAALGKRFERLTVTDGRTFDNALVVRVEDGGVSIRHDDGAATLKYGDLTPQQRDEFGLEAESSIAAEQRSAEQQAEYERWMTREMVALEKKRDETLAKDAASMERDVRLRAAALAQTESDYQNRPLARAATPVGSGSIWRNSWYGDSYDYPYRRRTVTYYTPYSSYSPSYQNPSACGASGYRTWPSGNAGVRTPVPVRPSQGATPMTPSP